MKLNYKLKVFLLAFVFGVFTNVTVANNPTQLEINANNSDNWELVKEENGIKIYFKEYTGTDGVTFLMVKFENTLNTTTGFTWSLINDSESIVKDVENTIAPLSSIEIDPATVMISINRYGSYKNYSIKTDLK